MEFLYESGGRKWYFAKPGEFTRPGVWFWDGKQNIHIDDALPPAASGNPATARSDESKIKAESGQGEHP